MLGSRMTRHFLTIVAVLLFAGCRPAYFAKDIRLQRKVETAEVIGTWKLRGDSLETAKREGQGDGFTPAPGQTYQILFRSDGTCHFSSLTQMPLKYADYEGTWRLDFRKNEHRPNELSVELKRGAGYGFTLEFTEEDGRLVIWEYLGDPDDWQFLKYDKEPNQSAPANVRPAPPAQSSNETR